MKPNPEDNRPAGMQLAPGIPLFSGRPARDRVIGRDDLLDLDILLHTCDSVESFLAKV